ncbi:hypothetical protein ABT095_26435 [Kitasatospora sp. NPDC002227]|uniref:hypothetical protein n=1 Tax=Kitasatospora sp. NPDC002227 TaxID=3154773 RepID=UPI0033284C44
MMEEVLSAGMDPIAMTDDERVRFQSLLMAFIAEFLISQHGAKWDWVVDDSSPLGGRWVVNGIPHPLNQQTFAVDVGQIAHNALASRRVSLVSLVNEAERESGMRIIRA